MWHSSSHLRSSEHLAGIQEVRAGIVVSLDPRAVADAICLVLADQEGGQGNGNARSYCGGKMLCLAAHRKAVDPGVPRVD